MEILFDEIPSLDLADFTSGTSEQKTAFVKKLGEAYQNIGFVAVKNHGLSQDLQDRLYQSIKAFFSLPDELKKQYEKPEIGYQRGYTGKGKEHAKGRNTGDLKEFYHVGQELEFIPDSDPERRRSSGLLLPDFSTRADRGNLSGGGISGR